MKSKLISIFIAATFFGSYSCSEKDNLFSQKSNVTKVITKLLVSYESKNMELLSNIMAHDEDMVSFRTDLSEHFIGWEAWKTLHLEQWEVIDETKITSTDLTVFLAEKGNIAWFSDVTNWNFKIKDNSIKINNIRITGVLEKRKGKWKIVQIHMSIPQGQSIEYE